MSKKFMVNVDWVGIGLQGMDFNNPSTQEVTLLDKNTGEIKARYGNRVFMAGRKKTHRMSLRTKKSGTWLFIEGSPFAFKYGQNIYTSSDVLRGCIIAIKRALKVYEIKPTTELLNKWLKGDFILTRVDLAVNFRLKSEAEVLAVLKQIRRQLIEQVGPTRTRGTSVYWDPKDGKEYSIGFYAKGPQLRRSKQYSALPERDQLIAEGECILRVEIKLREAELIDLNLTKASNWEMETASIIFEQFLAKLNILSVTSGAVTDEELANLPSNLRHVLVLHKAGEDLARIYSARTLQRHLKAFRELGIDLKCPNQDADSITTLPEYLSLDKAISKPPKWIVEAKLVPTARGKTIW